MTKYTENFIFKKIALLLMTAILFTNSQLTSKKILHGYISDLIVTLENIFSFLRVSSLFVGSTGFFVTYISFIMLGLIPNIIVCSSVFLMVFSVYNLNKLTDQKEDAINMPERLNFLKGRKRLIICYSLAAYAISALLLFLDKPLALPIIFIPLATNAVYGSRLIPGLPRIKDIPVMKNIFVALSWTLVCVLLPAAYLDKVPEIPFALLIYFILIKLFINAVLYDIRDIKGDSQSGIRTLAVIAGPKNTVLILLLLNSTLIPWLLLIGDHVRAFPAALILYGFAYISYFGHFRCPQALDFFVEGEWMLASIVLLALNAGGLLA